MAGGGQLHLRNKSFLLISAFILVGCARSAPVLPPDTSSDDPTALSKAMLSVPPSIKAMSCTEINSEFENLAKNDQVLEEQIHSNRHKNQTAGYIAGVIFPPLLLAVDNDDSAKGLLDKNQYYRDQLIITFRAKKCPTTK